MEARDVHPNTIARLSDSLVAKLKLTGDKFVIQKCSICGYKCGFVADKELGLNYGSGCYCTHLTPRVRSRHAACLRDYLEQVRFLLKALNYLNRPYHDFAERSVATKKDERKFLKLKGECV